MSNEADFSHLIPDTMLDAVESVLGCRMSGLATPLPSYINRVYETQAVEGTRYIAKFYRPGRWSLDALKEEHSFVLQCAEEEIPVIAPLELNGQTLHEADGVYFTLFPKRFGRQLELNTDEDWTRAGSLLGRVHLAGSRKEAEHRTDLHPAESTGDHLDHLIDKGLVTPNTVDEFDDVTSRIMDLICEPFDDIEFIRIHGDCHCGNLLDRPGEGIMMIDFDDMMVGPPIQDIWLLLPDKVDQCNHELRLLLRGYEQFREFDDHTLRLVEPLRAMRIIYYLAWCSHQINDSNFRKAHPEWGSDAFWQRETADLWRQYESIREVLT